MEAQDKQRRIWTNEVPRWIDNSRLSHVLSNGEWAVFQGLIKAEARLAATDSEFWSEHKFCGWFKVRMGQELIWTTGLSERNQSKHILALQNVWHLIEVRQGRQHEPSSVRFVMRTIEQLALYCLPRISEYNGGVRGKDLQDRTYFWTRPDLNGYGFSWKRSTMEELLDGANGEDPDVDFIKRLLQDDCNCELRVMPEKKQGRRIIHPEGSHIIHPEDPFGPIDEDQWGATG